MKKLLVILSFLFYASLVEAQSCQDFTFTSSDTAYYSPATSCPLLCNPTQESGWTGYDCNGYINIYLFAAVTSYTFYFGSVNMDDYATISIDGGGVMSLSDPVNTSISNDSVIGPYDCNGVDFGDVGITVNSTAPFQYVYIQNTGCSSGWVIFCSEDAGAGFAGNDTSIYLCDDSLVNLFDYIPFSTAGGSWTDVSNTGEFDPGQGTLQSQNLTSDVYNFIYEVDDCGSIDAATIKIYNNIDSICFPPDTSQIDTIVIPPIIDNSTTNAFSPNDDGMNDYFWINNLDLSKNNTVTIFNRWGDQIAFFQNYNNSDVYWDGFVNNRLASAGTYFYVLEYESGEAEKGWVQLIR